MPVHSNLETSFLKLKKNKQKIVYVWSHYSHYADNLLNWSGKQFASTSTSLNSNYKK